MKGRKITSILLMFILMLTTLFTATPKTAEAATPGVTYRAHVQSIGWQGWKSNGALAGTTGQSKRVEAIQIKLTNASGGIQYNAHVQGIGWQGWKSNGIVAGTTGQSKRM